MVRAAEKNWTKYNGLPLQNASTALKEPAHFSVKEGYCILNTWWWLFIVLFVFKVGNVVLWAELNTTQHKRCNVEQSLQTVTN